jgi:hypothetical protein
MRKTKRLLHYVAWMMFTACAQPPLPAPVSALSPPVADSPLVQTVYAVPTAVDAGAPTRSEPCDPATFADLPSDPNSDPPLIDEVGDLNGDGHPEVRVTT